MGLLHLSACLVNYSVECGLLALGWFGRVCL